MPGLPGFDQQQLDPKTLQSLQQGQNLMGQMGQPAAAQPKERLYLIIEHLCDHLRELRRENPDKFFGSPHEKLYRALDAGLESFYRDDGPKKSSL